MTLTIEEAHLTAATKKNISASKFAGPHGSYPVEDKEHLEKALQFAHFSPNPDKVRARAVAIAKRDGIVPQDYQPAHESFTEASMAPPVSHDDTRAALQRELDAEHLAGNDDDGDDDRYTPPPRVSDVFPKYFTFQHGWDDGKHFQRDYKIDADGRAKLGPVSQPVFKRAVYVPADASSATAESDTSSDGETLLSMPYIALATLHEAGSRHSAEDTQHINDIHAHLGQARSHIDGAAGHVTGLGASQNPATAYQTYGMGILTASDDAATRESDLTESAVGEDVAIHESNFAVFAESSAPKKGTIKIRIIKPGFNTSQKRYYTKGAIAEAHTNGIFADKKMYIDHPTKSEQEELPERSLSKIGAVIKSTSIDADGAMWGEAAIVNPQLKETLGLMQEQGVLGHAIGVSINAKGRIREGTVEGKKTAVVEAIHPSVSTSVDFVTEPGAGGRVALMESNRDDAAVQESQGVLTVTPEQVQAILDELKTVRESNVAMTARLEESEKARQEADARAAVAVRVQTRLAEIPEADLPAHSKARVAAVMEGAVNDERLEEAIAREIAYVKQTVEHFKVAQPGRVTGLGGNANRIAESSRDVMAPTAVKEAQDYLIESAGPIWGDKPDEFAKFAKSIGVL